MKVGYVIVRENIDDALIKSQSIDVIEEVNRSESDVSIELIWFYRVDYLIRYGSKRLRRNKLDLEEKGIKSYFIPFVGPSFPVSWWFLPFTSFQWMLGITYLYLFKGIKNFHCRSYHAGLIGFLSKILHRTDYIFDPRSPFPEENVSARRWKPNSRNFKVWKKIESLIVDRARKTTLVSPFLKDEYWGKWKADRFVVIPNNYPKSFDQITENRTKNVNAKYELVYVGSFGHWNKPGPYLKLLKKINELGREPCKMLFLVRSESNEEIFRLAKLEGIDSKLFDVRSVPQSEVKNVLEECRVGVYLMQGEDPRLGVKTVEYIRSGLSVIVSENIKGAANIVSEYGLGITWDHGDESIHDIRDHLSWVNMNCDKVHNTNVNFAKLNFSSQSVALRLVSSCLRFLKAGD